MKGNKTLVPFAGMFQWLRQDAFRITRPRLCALMVAILCLVVYSQYLNNPLVFDDHNVLGNVEFINHAFLFSLSPRWLPYATLAHTHVLLDGSIFAMRVGNLLLHAFNVILVFLLLRRLCSDTFDGIDTKRRDFEALVIASAGAALFAVHPVAVYAVGYVVQRSILMSLLFLLLMLITYLRWLQTWRTSFWVWSAVFYLLSVCSKEHSVAAPLLVFLLTLVLHRPSIELLRRLLPPFVVYTVIAVMVIAMVKGVLGAAYEPLALDLIKGAQVEDSATTLTYPLSIVTQMFLYFKYLLLWMFPNVHWMSLDMREPMATSLFSWPYAAAALGLACYVLLAMVMLLRRGRIGLAGWTLLFPAVMFTTEFSTIRVQEPFVLYRAYLWFPLLWALLPMALIRVRVKVLILLMAPTVCLFVVLSWNRLHSLSDGLLTWDDAAKLLVTGKEAGAGRIYYNRALALSTRGRNLEALADLDRALQVNPNLAPIHFAKAQVNFGLKRYAEALANLNQSIVLDPMQSGAYHARSAALKRLGRERESLEDLRKSCDMKNFIACYALGQQTKKPEAKAQ